jgi:ribosomal protein S18 acetylase RimI-like enzyme
MSQTEFEAYLEFAVQDYAQEHVRAGNWSAEEARQRSEDSFHSLLPDGVATQNQHLFTIEDQTLGEKLGMLWFAVEQQEGAPRAFLYDIRIDEAYRRRGYGSQALQALEAKVRELGLTRIVLHVFGHNDAARAMYAKLGYEAVDLLLAKTLRAQDGNERPGHRAQRQAIREE